MEKLKYKPYFTLGLVLILLGNVLDITIFFIIGVLITGGLFIYWILIYYLSKPEESSEQSMEVVEQQSEQQPQNTEETKSEEVVQDKDYENIVAETMANGKENTSEIPDEVR